MLLVASLTATAVKTVEEIAKSSRFWYDTVALQFARV
jgi:hypothetical protein